MIVLFRMFEDIFEEEMARKSIFKDQSKLSPDYVPGTLVHRDEEFRELSRLFKPVLEDKASQRVLITGSVGVGKTALSLRFGRELEAGAEKRGFRHDYVHINCRKERTPYTVIRELMNHYFPRLSRRGFAPEELLSDVVDWLESHDAYLTVGLDELDFFVRQNGPDLLYSFIRAGEETGAPNRLSVIAISRSSNFFRLLDEATMSTFMHNKIELDKYNAQQLTDILKNRVKVAFRPGTVNDEVIDLISEAASQRGDARFALELLWHAGRLADKEGLEKVTLENARTAKARIHPEIRTDVLLDLRRHERLLLLALARHLKISDKAYTFTGELDEAYKVVCEEYGEKAFKHTKVWEILKKLSDFGLIKTQPAGMEKGGRSQRISVPDAPVETLEKELEKILDSKKV